MSEVTKTLRLTQREIDLVLECIGTNIETVKRRHPMTGSAADLIQELGEMDIDIREQAFRNDGWDDPEDPDLFMDPVDFAVKHDAETQMFNAGVEARENMKASSHAAGRRDFNLKGPDKKLTAQQRHDVWDANDPKNW
tara:strand:+ start:260 stop:673 length:414 start_codon:yes stop_codon:yes gene_type:complete